MSTAISIYHGKFGRASLYELNRPMTTHAHREGHLVFHIKGRMANMVVTDENNDISPELAVAINPWQAHSFHPQDYEKGSLFLVLYIKPIWFLEVGRSIQGGLHFGRTAIEMTGQIRQSVQKVVALLLDCSDSELFDGYLYELARACYDQSRQWSPGTSEASQSTRTIVDFRVRKSIQLLNEKLESEVEFDKVAKESGLSRPHFYKLFRLQTGITPNLYYNTLRMEKAIELLAEGEQSVTDVGFELGFSCQSGFSRFFIANAGLAPSAYRRVTHRFNA